MSNTVARRRQCDNSQECIAKKRQWRRHANEKTLEQNASIERRPAFAKVYVCFSCIKKMLGRIETRTRDRTYCQTIQTVRDISLDDRARIATCSLRTLTDILKEKYGIDDI